MNIFTTSQWPSLPELPELPIFRDRIYLEYFPRVATRTRSRLSMETAVEKAKEMRRRGKDIRHRQGKMWRLWRGVKIGGFHGISRSTSVNIGQLCSKMFQDVPSLQRCHGGSRQVAVRLVEAQACKARRDLQWWLVWRLGSSWQKPWSKRGTTEPWMSYPASVSYFTTLLGLRENVTTRDIECYIYPDIILPTGMVRPTQWGHRVDLKQKWKRSSRI